MLRMNTASVIETLEDFVETVKPQFVKGSSRYLSTDVVPLAEALLRFEERYVREALIGTGGNRAAAMWLIKRLAVDHWDVDRAATEATALGLTSSALKTFAVEYVHSH